MLKKGNTHYFKKATYQDLEIFPRQTKKIFMPNPNKQKYTVDKEDNLKNIAEKCRFNQMNIQMIPKSIFKQVFKGYPPVEINKNLADFCRKNLEKHNINVNENVAIKEANFELPPLEGMNLEEHFYNIAEEQSKPYRELVQNLLKHMPKKPIQWILQEGWTKYTNNGTPQKVLFPEEDAFVFDAEVCMSAGKGPTMATAVSNKAWYGWVSKSLIDSSSKPIKSHEYFENELIPLESSTDMNEDTSNLKKQKIMIGHNVSYDRALIKEQYWLKQTGLRFIDTMSLHVCISGLTSYQRAVLKAGKDDENQEPWKAVGSLNSLSEVYKLYCGKEIKKDLRNTFVEGSISEVKSDFQNLMDYCSNDVEATYFVLKKMFPLFLERFPHPVTLAGMLELGMAYLPVNSNWKQYLSNSQEAYEDLEIESRLLLARRADQACQLLHDEKYKEDIWMWDQDWQVKNIRLKKTTSKNNKKFSIDPIDSKLKEDDIDEDYLMLKEKFRRLFQTKHFLPEVATLLPGYPNWYRKLCTKPNSSDTWIPGPHLISTSMQITPKLLSLTWEGYPLHFIRGLGWGFLVPFKYDTDVNRKLPLKQLLEKCPLPLNKPSTAVITENLPGISKEVQENLARREYYSRVKKDKTEGIYKGSGVWCNTILEDCCWFFKLPHKDGISYRVGNPLAKDFLNKFSENVLAGDTENAEKVLSIARQLSYWRNNRNRIMSQMLVWLDNHKFDNYTYGAIIPQVVVCGTLTRRAMEPTWMTASNAHPERVGSELRAMVQAPPGYNIIGADVDSQELWIASILGDAYQAKEHGSTPFGWMTLSGNKSDGTDMHSVTAKAIGISRDHAKVINYARIYGAGQNFAERLLKQFNPTLSDSDARNKAIKMFNLTKGKRIYQLRKEFLTDLPDQPYSKWQVFDIAKAHGKTVNEIFHKPKWVGGTESSMFNCLEEIADSPTPSTPFLKSRLSRALEPKLISDENFLPTRINWVVQSGAVDFLHLMLVNMRWLLKDQGRFCLSFHDEVRYLIPEHLKYQAALSLHVTNLLTRAFCSVKVGLHDLPYSVAFFSSVEIDTVLRKESQQDCKTPSNPHGLEKGYGIPNGESLNIFEAIEKVTGNKFWYKFNR